MECPEFRKQISLFLQLSDWKAIRQEAARQKIPMTELCRRWMEPELRDLRLNQRGFAVADDDSAAESL